jgi:glycosyltransferase involved in cell wall biosynthesis
MVFLKKELQRQIDNLSLSDNISLLGYIDDSIGFLNSGKVFLTTSKTEGLPRTVIQSISCGTPVIASNVGDMSDLVMDNKTGFLIEDYREDNFINAISSILNSDQMRNSMSTYGKEFVKKNYDHKAARQVWINILEYLNL